MLVLSRKLGEKIRLRLGDDGPEIWLTVIDIDRGKCRLGISAPPAVQIMREELVEAVDGND